MMYVWAMWQVLPSVREALLLFMRAHLMVFYFEGTTTILTCTNEIKPQVYKLQSNFDLREPKSISGSIDICFWKEFEFAAYKFHV